MLAPSGHGRCRTAPGMVTAQAEDSDLRMASFRPARSLRGSVVSGLALAIALTAVGPAVRATAALADGSTGLPNLTFYGRGYGHGVGMSQYGARGRALAGQLAPEI